MSLNNTNQSKPIRHSILTNSKMDGSLPCFRKLMQYKTQVGWLLPQHNTSHPKPEYPGSISTGMTMIREHANLIENQQWQKQYLIPSLFQTTVNFTRGAGTRGNLASLDDAAKWKEHRWWMNHIQQVNGGKTKSFLARYDN